MIDAVKERVKKTLKNSRFGGVVYEPLHRLWRLYSVPRRRRNLHKNGYRLLEEIDALMIRHGIPYYCEAGTLLGLIRDKGFIRHDDDIDLGVLPETVKPAEILKVLLSADFKWVAGHEYDGRFIEFTVEKYGIPVDVFFHRKSETPGCFDEIFLRYYKDVDYPSDRNNSALLFRYVATIGLKRYQVRGIEVNVPENYREVLSSLYGPWETPDPNFKSESTGYTLLPHFSNRLTQDEALSFCS